MNTILIASWLFLFGSIIFTVEAISEMSSSPSLSSFIHFLACLSFAIGSVFFIKDSLRTAIALTLAVLCQLPISPISRKR